ncbi:hypothetical protein Tco_0004629 [Tanacetum coccineum]
MRVRLWIQQRHELPCASRKFQGIGCAMIGGEGDGVSNWTSSGVFGERALCVSWCPNQVSPLESDLGKSMSLPQSLEKLPKDSSVEVEKFGVLIQTLWKTQDQWIPQRVLDTHLQLDFQRLEFLQY